jgi:hypothetical protein
MLKITIEREDTQIIFSNLAAVSDEWKLKLLQDCAFINLLLACPDSEKIWRLFEYLAQHPGKSEIEDGKREGRRRRNLLLFFF